jgi:exopolysaccharide production protein ExoZ
MATAPDTSLATLQAGRALAALAVVALHTGHSVSAFVGPPPAAVSAILEFGYLGVDFFFVLSGFIIFYTYAPRAGRPGWSKAYAASRLSRIYVPYLPIGIGMACAYILLPGMIAGQRDWSWLASATLLPGTGYPALGVAWTLQHELAFYAIGWLMLRTGHVLAGSLLWGALIVICSLLWGPISSRLFALINLEFLFGMAAAWRFMKGKLPGIALLLLAGSLLLAAFFLGGFFLADVHGFGSIVFSLGLAFLIAAAVKAETEGRLSVAAPLLLLGNASYAIYLIHVPFLSLGGRGLGLAGMGWAAALPLLFGAAALAGLAYHLWFERPALRAVRRYGARADPAAGAGGGTGQA